MSLQAISTTAPAAETTQRLGERIRDDINERTFRSILDLDVRIADGSVIVSGRTSRYYYKQLATRAVFDLVSDLELENHIQVRACAEANRRPK